jgi:hypothetical protein
VKSGGAGETGGSGRSSGDERDTITRSERRARGRRWSLLSEPEAGWLIMPAVIRRRDICDEGQVKPRSPRGDVDLALKLGVRAGRVWLMATHLGLEPCWGKLDARNLRGGAGNVAMRAGLRPTAKAVATPPDATAGAPALYPTMTRSDRESPVLEIGTPGLMRRGLETGLYWYRASPRPYD